MTTKQMDFHRSIENELSQIAARGEELIKSLEKFFERHNAPELEAYKILDIVREYGPGEIESAFTDLGRLVNE